MRTRCWLYLASCEQDARICSTQQACMCACMQHTCTAWVVELGLLGESFGMHVFDLHAAHARPHVHSRW